MDDGGNVERVNKEKRKCSVSRRDEGKERKIRKSVRLYCRRERRDKKNFRF